jgi:hypothetical protein
VSSSDEIAEIERIYRQYFHDYPLQLQTEGKPIDFAALGFWAFPLVLVGDTIAILDEPAYDAIFSGLYDRYRDDGWAGRVEVDDVRIHMPRTDLAILEGRGTRYRADGSVIDGFDSVYFLRRFTGRWQCFLVVNTGRPRPRSDQWEAWFRASFGNVL